MRGLYPDGSMERDDFGHGPYVQRLDFRSAKKDDIALRLACLIADWEEWQELNQMCESNFKLEILRLRERLATLDAP